MLLDDLEILDVFDFKIEDDLAPHHLETMTDFYEKNGYFFVKSFERDSGLIIALFAKRCHASH